MPNGNGEYQTYFTFENILLGLNTKFKKKKRRKTYGVTPIQTTLKTARLYTHE